MKPFRNIITLALTVCGIVSFWLAPGINKADDDAVYTRIYEDTDNRAPIALARASRPMHDTTKRDKKVYKKESIRRKDRLSKVSPKMYSRAIHFEEVRKQELAKSKIVTVPDSVPEKQAVARNLKEEKVTPETKNKTPRQP